MRGLPFVVRFFHVAPPTARATSTAFAVTTAVASAIVLMAPERAAAAMMPVLLLQLFTVSSGFLVPARRGHYDILLAMGQSRAAVALMHWIASAAAGLASCAALLIVEAVGGGEHARLRTSGTLLAIGVASTLPWAINVRVPRYTGAIGWLIVLLTAHAAAPLVEAAGTAAAVRPPVVAERAITFVLYPATLVGRTLDGPDWVAATLVSGVATVAMAWALATVHRSDIPLEAAQ